MEVRMSALTTTASVGVVIDPDPHGVWSPSIFRLELERALTKALAEERFGRGAAERRARRQALANSGAQVVSDESHRLPEPRIVPETADWYSDAPKATGEEQDVVPDEADEELRKAAAWLHANPEPLDWQDKVEWISRYEWLFFVSMEDADAVALRTVDEIRSDEDVAQFVTRDSAPAPRGYGMTESECRRKWLMDARLRYAAMLEEALRRHRALAKEQIKHFPALKSEAQFARSVLAKWSFVDELERHGVHSTDAETAKTMKQLLGGTYAKANEALIARRRLAEAGKLDRFKHELV